MSVDYEARVDLAAVRKARVGRVLAEMAAAGLDALLVWKDENVRCLSGLRAQIIQGKSALLNGCLLRADGAMTLLLSGGEVDRARATMPWIEDIRPIPIMEARGLVRGAFETAIVPALRDHGLAARRDRAAAPAPRDRGAPRLGVDELAYAQLEAFAELAPEIALADGDAVMQAARLVKAPGEIALMQQACAIAEAVTEAAIDAVRPGVRECEVAGEAMRALYRLGGEMAHLATPFVASGEHMGPPHRFSTDKLVREGDLVFLDIGAMWNGYYADIGRTVVCGRPSRRQQELYTAVHDALQAATKAMRAGATNDDVAAAVHEAARGFGDRFLSLFIGHGIGMGANEPPYVGEDHRGADTITLQPGMTMAIEPLIWEPGRGVRLEDTILVGDDGGIPLSRSPFDERLLV